MHTWKDQGNQPGRYLGKVLKAEGAANAEALRQEQLSYRSRVWRRVNEEDCGRS